MHVLKGDIISTSTEIYNTLFRKLLTRYSQIFEEERSFSKFHTSINSSRETNFKSLLSLRREKFFDFFTLLPASEELLSGENLSPFLSNLSFIPALFPPPRPPLIFRACRVNRLLTKFFSSRKKVLVSRAKKRRSSLCDYRSFRDKGPKISERTSYRSANQTR